MPVGRCGRLRTCFKWGWLMLMSATAYRYVGGLGVCAVCVFATSFLRLSAPGTALNFSPALSDGALGLQYWRISFAIAVRRPVILPTGQLTRLDKLRRVLSGPLFVSRPSTVPRMSEWQWLFVDEVAGEDWARIRRGLVCAVADTQSSRGFKHI